MFLLVNTVSMSFYYINVKELSLYYPPISLAAWAYLGASLFMGISATLFSTPVDWMIPGRAVGPLLYLILVGGVGCFFALTWAAANLAASLASSFVCLQSFFGAVLSIGLLGEVPTVWDLGAVGIIIGLFLIVSRSRSEPKDYLKNGIDEKLMNVKRLV
eukprot:TRINITY_DN8998_c1_g1_i3.p1 TRINITY_DN8998_c1_g1~~TRINITY_DN8998_c1_g1_i3.p1  ORF type:complete len:178 (+),score=22.84 TRINITY_DN8998_c1_g1_i3:58-534(+)